MGEGKARRGARRGEARRGAHTWTRYPVPTLPTPPTLPTRTITFFHYGCRVRETERSERCTSFGARTSATRHGRPRARWTNTNTTTTKQRRFSWRHKEAYRRRCAHCREPRAQEQEGTVRNKRNKRQQSRKVTSHCLVYCPHGFHDGYCDSGEPSGEDNDSHRVQGP